MAERIKTELKKLKRNRGNYAGTITKAHNKLLRMLAEDPATHDQEQLEKIRSSISRVETQYEESRTDVEHTWVDVEDDPQKVEAFEQADEDAYDTFTENVGSTRTLVNRLIALRSASLAATSLRSKFEAIDRAKSLDPTGDHETSLASLTIAFDKLKVTLDGSTIQADHPLRQEATEFENLLCRLSIKEKKSDASPTSTTIPAPTTGHKTHHLPKMTLPTFHGDLMAWTRFWAEFQDAVDKLPDLTESSKLSYLREAIQCPTTRALMMGSVEHSARYPEVVAMLHRRFDKKRLIHFKHCCTLTKTTTVKNTFAELNTLADELTNASTGMKDLGQFDIESLVTSLNVVRLTKSLREQWELQTDSSSKVPHMGDFIDFVRKRADGLALDTALEEEQGRHSKHVVKTEPKSYRKDHSRQKAAVHTSTAPPPVQQTPSSPALPPSYQGFRFNCILCNQKHPTFLCPKFINMSVPQRSDHLKANHLCFNCLAPGHKTAECRSLSRCRSCQGRHHTMVHREVPTSPAPPNAATNAVSTAASPSLQSSLTMTSQVLLEGPFGRKLVCRALLDSGSTISLISTKAANSLQLAKTQTHITFSGIQDSTSAPSHALITVSMFSLQAPDQPYQLSAAVVPIVTCDLPLQGAAGVPDLPHLKDLELADPTFHLPGRVDLLLGENILSRLLKPDIRVGPEGTPIAWKTVFGWAIRGPFTPSAQGTVRAAAHVNIPTVVTSTDQILTRFWESEEPPTMKNALTPEEEQVQRHFETTCVYLPEAKRYEVSLLRKPGVAALGDSRTQALQRYQSNERALLRKGTWEPFQAVIQEYLDLGHAQSVPSHSLTTTKESYYLPMHGVVKASSTSTKLRVVFDASAKSSSSLSLNDTLLVGPTLHPNLDEILLRFRTYRVALTGDISKMYREVQLSEPDRQLHRFLWRAQPTDPICDYQMNRVTFGVASSPHLAVRTLQQTAQDHGSQHPKASWHVHHSFYVDDLLSGADTPEAAIQLHDELRSMLLQGGFNLRKWRSSSDEVLNHINPVLLEKLPTKDLVDHHSATYPKALGLEWDSAQDTMATSITLPTAYTSTKRGIISDVAKTFDILGWLAPTILEMKILYQQLWEEKLGWDDTVPEPYRTKHQDWRTQLPILSDIRIPRCYFSEEATLTVELHGFSDASEAAYAAVVYLRATYLVRSPTCRLVMAKTKVAPVKTISVPRLELCGASLLAKLLTSVRTSLDIPLNQIHAWSDSSIVLAWLDGSPKRYKTFVGNRIAAITELVPPSSWKHVPTEQNPADCASRGLSPTALRDHPLWWNGPPWLAHEHVQIPVQPTDDELVSLSTLETKAVPCNTAVPVPPEGMELKCSSYHTQLRVTAWYLRAVHNFLAGIRGHTKRLTNDLILTAPEIASAEQLLFSQSQQRTFTTDLAQLKATPPQPLRNASNLLPLAPFLGKDGLIQVGGRLSNAAISPSQKHPVVLSGKDMLTKLLFEYDHRVLGHCGPTLLLSHEGSRLHVLGARRLARSVCRDCITCKKAAATTESQLMGQLPAARVTPSPPFTITGIDYAGPFTLKRGHTRKPVLVKAYLALFVCLATKAVHLEIVSDLTTEAFLASLKRFISRRGLPTEIHTDNGTNFRGAKNDLADLYHFLADATSTSTISSYLLTQRITWHCIPERAPHFGGLWEAAVKSTKFHLKRVIGSQRLDYEEFSTVATQVESCLNSRPLTSTTSHPVDGITILTPGHFLIGRALCAYPETVISSDPSLHRRWVLCQAIIHHFWRRWSAEYLQHLQKAGKWRTQKPNLQPGDIVVVTDDASFTNHWPMGLILKTYPGKDGLVRAVDVKTATTVLKRPIAKLALLIRSASPTTAPRLAAEDHIELMKDQPTSSIGRQYVES